MEARVYVFVTLRKEKISTSVTPSGETPKKLTNLLQKKIQVSRILSVSILKNLCNYVIVSLT